MTMEILWEEPPEDAEDSGKRSKYRVFAAALRTNPGRWAVLPTTSKSVSSAKNTATSIRLGKLSGFAPAGAFETKTHETKIYVRCVEQAPAPEQEQGDTEEQPVLSSVEADHGRGAMIRSWARSVGIDVPERGRLAQSIVSQYELAHPPR